ncbi:hypothetical protein [Glycomyces sp. NPDC048151]|uniref:hypothetical protein n=1 Tax=Glycomyces sp. NPDC048151 TaxID=3364002 RepID=UPI00371ED914
MSTTVSARRVFAGLLVIGFVAVVFLANGGPSSGSTYTANNTVTYQDFGGTIRANSSGWYVIDDAAHTPDDITIGAVTSTSVRVDYPACAEIISVLVTPDDTYAKTYGATFGASVGLSYSLISGSINDGSDAGTAADVWDPTTDWASGSNIWISGRCIPA